MDNSNNSLPGLYLHIPFCKSKCPYCDFYSLTDLSLMPAWLEALKREVLLYKDTFPCFDTLYLGGGTPSLVDPRQLAILMACLRRQFDFAPDTEFTLEANPDDLTPEKLRVYRDLGINRLSLGVQSFDDQELASLGRRHTARQAERALKWSRAAGFTNLGIDLIYGLPGQTEEAWGRNFKKALRFNPEHLSCYQLTLEEGTPLGARAAQGYIQLPGEATQRRLFLKTSRFLAEHGYLHYEVSNFARGEAHFSRHSRKYWRHTPYLGLGPGAHSYLNGRRWWNDRSLTGYCRALAQGRAPLAGRETLSADQLRLESLYLGLRTKDGIPLNLVRPRPGWGEVLADLKRAGLVKVRPPRVVPTLKGFLVADRLPLRLAD